MYHRILYEYVQTIDSYLKDTQGPRLNCEFVCLVSVGRSSLRLLGCWISFWIKRTESFLISRLQQSVYCLAVRCGRGATPVQPDAPAIASACARFCLLFLLTLTNLVLEFWLHKNVVILISRNRVLAISRIWN